MADINWVFELDVCLLLDPEKDLSGKTTANVFLVRRSFVICWEEIDLRQVVCELYAFRECIDIDIITQSLDGTAESQLDESISNQVELKSYVSLRIQNLLSRVNKQDNVVTFLEDLLLVSFPCDLHRVVQKHREDLKVLHFLAKATCFDLDLAC